MKRSTALLLSMLFLLSSGTALLRAGTLVLDDFESDVSLELWNGNVTISEKFPAHGRTCLALDLTGRRSLESERLPRDWSAFKVLKFDIYNPGTVQVGSIQIFDELGTDRQAEYGQSYQGHNLLINRGWNHYEVNLRVAMVESGERPLALKKIRKFRLGLGRASGADKKLYLDNFRLVSGREDPGTASATAPRNCRVVIENRDAYPSLVGPAGEIQPSPEIMKLRAGADEAIDRLEREVEYAELQGYKPLYWRIPLITADVGLGVRSKCVWFQNEKEEKKILEYIISSCSGAADELNGILAASDRDIIEEPEDDVNPHPLYVPDYPNLRGLKQSDGYFRDENGDPVIIFSMLLLDEGPLMDYFAPFTHRIESYTVGGGSRYDIESSPVYEAFHKYPDTHRVGWDGWCGHLIKDQWSMGGKKENVVLCLESPHIRQAVLEYMKRAWNKWKENPGLLYNIMAYELTYICYCETSQQMFRDWLKKKHGTIEEVNRIWGTSYGSFSQVRAPETEGAQPKA
ncbi:MAG: beta-galactosidase, partial [Gemmatimonadota bacterium]|nr:beta-galactosidase [Gemmatimonadota bacterium]